MKERLIELAVSRLAEPELVELLRLSERAISESASYREDGAILGLLTRAELSTAFKTLSVLLNRTWRAATQEPEVRERTAHVKELAYLRERLIQACFARTPKQGETAEQVTTALPGDATPTIEEAIIKLYQLNVGRSPAADEIAFWQKHLQDGLPFHHFVVFMSRSQEAAKYIGTKKLLEEKSDGAFVQLAYEVLLGRGCKAREMRDWVSNIASGTMQRADVLATIFAEAVKLSESEAAQPVHDGLSCSVMGTSRYVTVQDWKERAQAIAKEPPPPADDRYRHRLHIRSAPRVLVSAIASLYKGGDFIEQFMDNITSQSCFDDYCELIIIDADSPDNESDSIRRYLARQKRINYIRVNYCIGIYDAWNVGVRAARGEYLTNTNLDDLRRKDSFELQAAVLDNLPFVDVTYQDFYYTFDPRLTFEEIARFGYESNLPIVTTYNMMEFNSPHNAPMWRKRLHDELGYFDTHYRSAGDYEFWMRCLAAGKCFYKLNDPHIVYYQNPKGLSTRPDTRGVAEAKEVLRSYGRKLVSENVTVSLEQFRKERLREMSAALVVPNQDRYSLCQQGLRNAARQHKYPALIGTAQ